MVSDMTQNKLDLLQSKLESIVAGNKDTFNIIYLGLEETLPNGKKLLRFHNDKDTYVNFPDELLVRLLTKKFYKKGRISKGHPEHNKRTVYFSPNLH